MTRAYLHITVQTGKLADALKALRKIEWVQAADAVTGPVDVVAVLEAANMDVLSQAIVQKVHKIPGIVRTETYLAVKVL